MKLTKKIEKEIEYLMEDYWKQYLTGKIEPWSKYLVDNYRNIGGTEEEIWNSKKEILDYTYGVIDQMKDKVQLQNKTIQIIPYEPYFMVHELLDMYVIVDGDWSFYGKFRLSSLIQKIGNDWKVLHQHGSYPDSKTQKGEAFAIDTLKAENLKLQNAVKERTIELEQRNRELEIETALERIRAQAVAMKESTDLLDIVVTMRNEFIKLGHEAHYFWHMMWLPKTYEKAMTSGDGSKIGFVMKLPRHIHGDIPLLARWEKSKKPTVIYAMSTEESIDYVDKMVSLGDFQNIDPQAPSHEDLKHIGGLTFIMARTTHGEIGYSLPGVVKNPPKDDIDILVKFAGAFDLAHQRFLDLQKAEKQARETQIELALEKVRSRTMAMQHSDELQEASFLLDQQVRVLGIETWGCAFNIYRDKDSTEWFGNEAGVLPTYTVPRKGIFKEYYQKGQQGESFFIKEFSGDKCVAHYEYMSSLPVIGDVLKDLKKTNNGFPTYQIDHVAYFKYGYLLFITKEHVPDAYDIFKRFAKVFEQTYTRFLDLQKAETQAKEAQIEAALERVRSRSMAMHDSNELKEVIQVLYDQFIHLGINVEHAGFIIDYKENDDMHIWLADKNAIFPKIVLPYFDCAHWNSFNNAKKKGLNFFANQLDFEEKNKFYKDLFQFIPDLPEETKATYFGFDGLAISTMLSDNVGLYIENYAGIPFSEAENKILMRFGKVFQQTYTRFLDLQKAEAQTREAQIEGALERVRARAMSMHHTDELTDVLCVLFDQFDLLGINPVLTHLTLFDLENEIFSLRITTSAKNRIVADQLIDVNAVDAWKNSYENWKKSDPNAIDCIDYANEDLPMVWELLNEVMNALPESHKISPKDFPNGLYTTQGHFKFGYIGFNHRRHSTDEEKSIVVRFAKEFGRAYQRFLDLQKAEAQAKEAQIEAALERVRSHSMGMQSTDDFGAVTTEMFNQLRNLGEDLFATGIVFCDKHEGHVEQWHSIPNGGMLSPFIVPIDLDYIHQYRYDQWKIGEELFSIEIPSDFIEQHFKDIFNLPSAQVALKDLESRNAPMPAAPPWEIDYGASFKNGYILASSLQHFENIDILPRFANVFEQAYTRFLDLQKAESQAREAQIEASLERVRSASMAMHKTEDLSEVVVVYFDQLKKLNIEFVQSWISIFQVEEGYVDVWFSPLEGIYKDPKHFKMPSALFEDTTIKSWKDGLPFSYIHLTSKEEVNQFMKVCDDVTASNYFMTIQNKLKLNQFEFVDANNKYGCISKSNIVKATKEEEEILQRFSKVFEQTYTRFLDLQKAEAQAREAQIEAALERVRAQSNAMHKSEDLANVVTTLYEELRLLNSKILRCGIGIINEKSRNVNTWITSDLSSGTSIELSGDEPLSGHPLLDSIFDYWMKQKNLSYLLEGKDLIEYYKTVIKTDFQKHFANEGLDNANVKQYYHCTMFPAGGLYVFESSPITKEQIIVLQRFTDAFNRAYTRHQDLQKAEAQAKEAQIEMALEKVRSRTMAMQNSNELPEAANNLFLQVQELGIPAWSAGYCIWENEDKKSASCNMSSEGEIQKGFSLPTIGEGYNFYDPYKKGEPFHVAELGGKKLVKHYDFMKTLPIVGEVLEDFAKKGIMLPTFQIFHIVYFSHGYLMFITYEPVPNDWDIFKRFGKVFQQTYTRFLDLQKAEAQAREAQINLAVERVRAKALAMHKSEEIIEVVAKLKDEVMNLDIPDVIAATIFLNEGDDKVRMWDLSSLDHGDNYLEVPFDLTFKIKKTDPHLYVKRVWENPENYFVEKQDGKDFKRLMQWLRELNKNEVADEVEDFMKKTQLKCLYHTAKKLNNGKLVIDLLNPPSNEMETILTKMGAAFDLAYKRFEDLKKAEGQAREALIEGALEKVRSRSLAMHNPDELQEVVAVVAEKLKDLGVIFDAGGVILCTYFPDNKDVVHWIAVDDFSSSGRYFVPYFDNPIFNDAWDSKIKGDAFFSKEFTVKAKNEFFKHAFKNSDYKHMPKDYKQYVLKADKHHLAAAWSKNSAILIPSLTGAIPSESDAEIMQRFAKVFEQAYIRFLDLQKSEAQTREAQIEAALEKVRSRSLAMHKSEELREVVLEVHQKFQELDISMESRVAVIVVFDEDSKNYNQWIASDDFSNMYISTPYFKHRVLDDFWIAKEKGVDFYSGDYSEDEKNSYFKSFFETSKYTRTPAIEAQSQWVYDQKFYAYSPAFQKNSSVGIADFSGIALTEGEIEIIKRFSKVFEQAYIRFLDLQKAEAQARESQIEAALERVRTRALAMHNPEELKEVAHVLRTEMGLLGVDELETCSIYINDEETEKTECWYAIKDIRSKKQKLINDHFELNLYDTWVGKEMLKFYKSKNNDVSIVMTGKNRKEWIDYCEKHSKSLQGYYGKEIPDRTYHLYKFSHGAIGVATAANISDENWNLIKRTASTFSLAYSRFKDLTQARIDLAKLKEEKKRAEDALSELQLTQTQLIQSEKMASLGELTAGIAHEIQNPLNFVNNFSEVSQELLDEMIEELENGNMEEVKAITDDVIQNLEKINHHGKRADGIVKGMLQHSRSSTGTKEPTDINVLGDEYLRLAYHGLRAKDKGFNATLVTDFDENIGTVNMIPQDIGRVVLNLLTNAFYVVNEKKQLNIDGYEPTVSLTTKKNGNLVSISVRDNGNGIPKHVMEKIFQPFFTTKPTGEGTGLGLSMSYDIVTKGHGGELKVETKQNKGTEFIIKLPI